MKLSMLIPAALAVSFAGIAQAGPITFKLVDVQIEGGIEATGSFDFDFSNNQVTNPKVKASGPTTGFFGRFAGGPVTLDVIQTNFLSPSFHPPLGQLYLSLFNTGSSPTISPNYPFMALYFLGAELSPTMPTSLTAGTFTYLAVLGPFNFNQNVTSGWLVPQTPTPEPGSYVLMASSIALLAARMRFKR